MNGWIKLHRELLEKSIWQTSTPEQRSVLVAILLMANHARKDWEWKGQRFEAQPGQLITSLQNLADKAGVSVQNTRSAIARFEKYGFLTNQSTKTGRLITIVNWGIYQTVNDETNKTPDKGAAKCQPTINKQPTTNKNYNNNKNYKNDNKYPAKKRWQNYTGRTYDYDKILKFERDRLNKVYEESRQSITVLEPSSHDN